MLPHWRDSKEATGARVEYERGRRREVREGAKGQVMQSPETTLTTHLTESGNHAKVRSRGLDGLIPGGLSPWEERICSSHQSYSVPWHVCKERLIRKKAGCGKIFGVGGP